MKNKFVYIIALLLTIETVCFIELHKQDKASIATLNAENVALKQEIEKMQSIISNFSIKNAKLSEEIAQLQTKQGEQKPNRGETQLTSLGIYTVTAYCPCEKCCGKRDRPNGKVYGAAGVELKEGISAAGWLLFGTVIMINGHKYTIQDRTAKWVKDKYDGKIIDLYFSNHKEALAWGKREIEIFEIR